MRRIKGIGAVAALAAVALLAVGSTAALAHGGKGRGGGPHLMMGGSFGSLLTEAASQLGVTKAALTAAIEKAANARVDEAVEDGDLDADDAADLKTEIGEDVAFAYHLTRASVVAKNLGITVAKLNTEFRDARKALLLKRIDEAVEDGDLDADDAAELKDEVADATFPGYKPSLFSHGFGPGLGMMGGKAGAKGFGLRF